MVPKSPNSKRVKKLDLSEEEENGLLLFKNRERRDRVKVQSKKKVHETISKGKASILSNTQHVPPFTS